MHPPPTTRKLPARNVWLCEKQGEIVSVRWRQEGKRWALSARHTSFLVIAFAEKIRNQSRKRNKYAKPFTWVEQSEPPPIQGWPAEARALLTRAKLLNWRISFEDNGGIISAAQTLATYERANKRANFGVITHTSAVTVQSYPIVE